MKPKLTQVDMSAGTGGQVLTTDVFKLKAITAPSASDVDSTKLYAEKVLDDNLKLLLNFEGTDAATTTKDESGHGNYITFYNHAKITNVRSKFGTGSFAFDGTDDYLSFPDTAHLDFGTGDFTIEMWIYVTANNANENVFLSTGTITQLMFRVDTPTTTPLLSVKLMNVDYTGSVTMTLNTWHHIAVTRASNSLRLFWNGTQVNTTATSNDNVQLSSTVYLGGRTDNARYMAGNMDEVRISKGFARYTANFTPSTVPFTTDANTVLLLHADGVEGQTFTTDSSECGHAISFLNHAQLDTAQYKYGASSLLLDGTDDYISLAANVDWQIWGDGVTNYTIETWLKFNSYSGAQFLFESRVDDSNRWYIYHSGGFYFQCKSAGTDRTATTGNTATIADNNWHHFAWIKTADKWGMYLDGQQIHYGTWSAYATQASGLEIGRYGASNYYFNGWLDSARIYKGNPYQASPQSDKSDTIVIPTAGYSGGNKTELKVRDEEGNVSVLSPHNFSLIPNGKSEDMAFSYYSEKGDKIVNVDLLKAVRLVEELTSEKLVYIKNKSTGEIS